MEALEPHLRIKGVAYFSKCTFSSLTWVNLCMDICKSKLEERKVWVFMLRWSTALNFISKLHCKWAFLFRKNSSTTSFTLAAVNLLWSFHWKGTFFVKTSLTSLFLPAAVILSQKHTLQMGLVSLQRFLPATEQQKWGRAFIFRLRVLTLQFWSQWR